MRDKVGRNDPCPCGSGKKYKQCCLASSRPAGTKKLTATWINKPQENSKAIDLMERTFGAGIKLGETQEKPPKASEEGSVTPS